MTINNVILPKQATKNTLSLIWHFVKKRPFLFLTYQLFAFGTAIDLIIWPLFIAHITQILYDIEKMKENAFVLCQNAIIFYGIILLISHLLTRAKAYFLANFVVPKLEYDISSTMMEYTLNRTHSFFINTNATELVSRIEMLSFNCTTLIENFVGTLMPNLFATIWIAFGLFFYHWSLGVCMVTAVTIHLSILVFYTKKTSNIMNTNSTAYNTLIAKMSDTMYNVQTVKSFANKATELKLLKIFFGRYMNTHVKSLMFTERMNWGFTITHLLFTGVIFIFLLIKLFSIGSISADDVNYALYVVVTSLLYSIWMFSDALPRLFVETGFCDETLKVLCHDEQFERTSVENITFKTGNIEFKNIDFGYEESNLLFNNFNLNIKNNEKIGLVGLSGSGKTTLINLIAANFNVNGGQIIIDGHDISTLSQDSVRKNIATIPQDPMLFNRSILDNIKYGDTSASFSDVVEAAKLAYADDFILDLDNGYHTIVADRGARLSGGQRQRIAIARAILKNSPILILDEATSALDKETEKLIQDSLQNLMKNKTAIVVAHKLETITKMDRILVFDAGKIVEEGTHQSLLADPKSYYSKMWNIGKEVACETLIA